MTERNQQAEERTEDNLCIRFEVPLSLDGSDTYIEIPADGEWHHIMFTGNANEVDDFSIDGMILRTLSENEVRTAYLISTDRVNDQAEDDLFIHVQSPISFDEGSCSYIEVPIDSGYHITWHYYITSSSSSESFTEERYYIPGHADRILTAEEYAALRELLVNHPEIKYWWIKNNILYLEVVEEE